MIDHLQPFVDRVDSFGSSNSSASTPSHQIKSQPPADRLPGAPEFHLKDVSGWFRDGRLKLIEGDDAFLSWTISTVPPQEKVLDFKPIEKAGTDDIFPGAVYQNEHGDALLHIAVRHKRWKSVNWLILRGADIYQKNKHGHTPKWLSRKYSPKLPPPLFKERQAQDEVLGGDFESSQDMVDFQGKPLQNSTPHCLDPVGAEEKLKMDGAFFKQDPLADQIVHAVKSQDDALVLRLVIQSSDLNIVGEDLQSPMGFLIEKKDWAGCSRLLDYGASLAMKDRNGFLWEQMETHREEIMLYDEELCDAFEIWIVEAKTVVSEANKKIPIDVRPSGRKQGKKSFPAQNKKQSSKKTRNFSGMSRNSHADSRALPEPKELYESSPPSATRPIVIFRKTRKITPNMG